MKLLLLGLLPLIIFWGVEEVWGTFWGLIAAALWAVFECIYEYLTLKKIEQITLISSGLVIGLGGLSLLLDNSVLFKFQPVILEVFFVIFLIWGGRSGEPLLMKLAQKQRPGAFNPKKPEIYERQKALMVRMTKHLNICLILHALLLSYVAVYSSTGVWIFWKGVGFFIIMLIWMGFEFFSLRRQIKR